MSMEAFERRDGGASLLSPEPRWPWMDDAACRDQSIDLFFPRKENSAGQGISPYRKALAICGRCPVATECREWNDRIESGAISRGAVSLVFGVFGGETPKDRIKRRRVEQAAAEGMVG